MKSNTREYMCIVFFVQFSRNVSYIAFHDFSQTDFGCCSTVRVRVGTYYN